MTNQPHSQPDQSSVKDSVLGRINTESVTPRPRWQFLLYEYGVWVLWALSVLLGAISFSVIDMIWDLRKNDIYEATHDTPLEFALALLPYLWLLIFAVMFLVAYKNLRLTKRGYKYPFSHIMLSSLGFSIVGGLLLQAAGVGMYVDNMLGEQMPLYTSQVKMELELWQSPSAGRLVGTVTDISDPDFAILTDVEGGGWQVYLPELKPADREELIVGRTVRVLGLPMTTDSTLFYACGVFPWLFDPDMPPQWMNEKRQAFLTRMATHQTDLERLSGIQAEVVAEHKNSGRCSELDIIDRIR